MWGRGKVLEKWSSRKKKKENKAMKSTKSKLELKEKPRMALE